MGFRARLGHYEYVAMTFGLAFVFMTLQMVNSKLPCAYNLPCNSYVDAMLLWIKI
jgi:hypothetical protein